MKPYGEWDRAYEHPLTELPWELGRPRPQLVKLIDSGRVEPCRTLDICCGAGTNTVYLAKRKFGVTAIDISKKAVAIAKQKASLAKVDIRFDVGNSVHLPYEDKEFGFVYDMGCFHHIQPHDRNDYIRGVHRVLEDRGVYFMTCFSYRNGPGWNRFSEEQIRELFSGHFDFEFIDHFGSVEGDGKIRYFYSSLMVKKN